jgi:hypothetical protein
LYDFVDPSHEIRDSLLLFLRVHFFLFDLLLQVFDVVFALDCVVFLSLDLDCVLIERLFIADQLVFKIFDLLLPRFETRFDILSEMSQHLLRLLQVFDLELVFEYLVFFLLQVLLNLFLLNLKQCNLLLLLALLFG